MKTDMKKVIFTLVSVLATALNAGAQTTLFKCGTENRYYRIPAILNQNGTLWAFSDDRTAANGDIGNGNIKIVAKTSSDNGSNWSSTDQVIASYDANATSPFFDYAHGDAAVVCDREDPKKMLLMCASGKKVFSESSVKYSDGTLDLTNAIRVGKYISTDGGTNWTGKDVTEDIYKIWDSSSATVKKLFFSSGRICQSAIIKNGDYYRLYAALCTNVGSLVVYSDDFGETWSALGGTSARPVSAGNEAKIEELPNGNVLISSRTGGGRYFNIYTYTDQNSATGSWGNYTTASIGSSNACNGEILLVPAVARNSNVPVYIALQSVPTGSTRANVSIYWKLISSKSDIDLPSDFVSDWKQYQVSTTTSAYSTMTLDNRGNIAFLYEENEVSNCGSCYDIQFQSLSLEKITSSAYQYTTLETAEAHRTAFLTKTESDVTEENTDLWEGKVVTLRVKLEKPNTETPLFFYLHNEGLSMKVEETMPTLKDYSYYWVISKNTEGNYYISSLKGDGYMGKGYGRDNSIDDENAEGAYKKNIPICTEYVDSIFVITDFVKQETQAEGKTAIEMDGYAIKFDRDNDGKNYRYIAVSEKGEINWFDHTAKGDFPDKDKTTYWTTDFEINEVTYVNTPNQYGNWDNPTYFNFPVKFARSDDGKAVVEAEDYNYYATLMLPFATILPEGVTAYKITGPKNKENEEVGLDKLTLTDNILPYETPVLLSMEGGQGKNYPTSKTIYLQPAKHDEIQTTGFKGTLSQKTFTDYVPSTNANYFILGKKNGRVAFYYLNNTVLAANKAYYVYDGATTAKTLTFSFQDTPSAIGMPEANDEDDMTAPVFDLSGRRITGKASKGVYIRNGKKFVVR